MGIIIHVSPVHYKVSEFLPFFLYFFYLVHKILSIAEKVRNILRQYGTNNQHNAFFILFNSPNQRLLAVSLLDCTVKVFFADTLKVCCVDSFL